jgi:hypothetical protein
MSKSTARVQYLLVAVLVVSAGLKILQFPLLPISHRTDPVLGFLTQRKTLILSSGFELILTVCLLKAKSSVHAGLVLLYFSIIASLYQLGLVLIGDPPCACLGIANNWLPGGVAKWITRSALVFFWVCTGLLLRHARGIALSSATGLQQHVKHAAPAVILAFLTSTSANGSTIRLSGYVTTQVRVTSVPREDRKDFTAWIDEETFRIDVPSASPNPRLGTGGPCVGTTYITKNHQVNFGRCVGLETIPVSLFDPEYAWRLGNCGATAESAVWLALRSQELFPIDSHNRALAPPWTTTGEPLGLVTELHYKWTDDAFDAQLLVSNELLQHWRKSPFRSAGLANPEVEGVFQRQLVGLHAGFLAGTIRMSAFTNMPGVRIPLSVDLIQFLPREQVKASITNQPQVTITLRFTRLESVNEPFDILPIQSQIMHVADFRLVDRDLGVPYGQFSTNILATLDISPLARLDFGKKLEHARYERRAATIKKIFSGLIVGFLLLAPLALYLKTNKAQQRKQPTGFPRAHSSA